MNKRFVFYVGVLCLLMVMPFSMAEAQVPDFLKKYEKAMPEMELLSPEKFKEETLLYDEGNFVDPALDFKIRVPKDWIRSDDVADANLKLTDDVQSDLVNYFGPAQLDEARQRMEIKASKLPYQMTAYLWLVQYLESNNYSVLGVEIEDERRVEALYVKIEDKISYVVRAAVQINADKVLFVENYSPLDYWGYYKAMQAGVISSMRPQQEIISFAEEMIPYPFIDYALLHYPASWELRVPKLKSVDRINAQLLKFSTRLDDRDREIKTFRGQIDVEFVSTVVSEGLDEELDKFNDVLAEKGLVLGELIETEEEMIFSEFVEFGQTEVFQATDSGNTLIDYEFWVTTLGTGDYYIFVTLLTPARGTNFLQWVENVETYKVVATNIEAVSEEPF